MQGCALLQTAFAVLARMHSIQAARHTNNCNQQRLRLSLKHEACCPSPLLPRRPPVHSLHGTSSAATVAPCRRKKHQPVWCRHVHTKSGPVEAKVKVENMTHPHRVMSQGLYVLGQGKGAHPGVHKE